MSEPPETVLMAGGQDWEQVVEAARSGDPGDRIVVNMGPQHPSTHGVLRLILEIEGSGGRRELHPPAPTDPYVNLSIHTAPVTLVTRQQERQVSSPSARRTAGTAW